METNLPASDKTARSPSDSDAHLAAFDTGHRRAIANVLTALETGRTSNLASLVQGLRSRAHGANIIGITGPPGAGKSTLVNALLQTLRVRGRRLAVIAVDPSSPNSGGAILGDRIRMSAAAEDPDIMIRSLSSAGHLGGVTPAAVRLIDGLDAAGFDPILIETVGTGQNEIDIARIADVQLVVAAPGLGDGVQAMKAGLLEIADILVVNKSDHPGAHQTRDQLQNALALRAHDVAQPPVLATAATTGTGIEELATEIENQIAKRMSLSPAERRQKRARYLLQQTLIAAIDERLKDPTLTTETKDLAERLTDGSMDADAAARALLALPRET